MPRPKSVIINIPEPCQENWEMMQPDSCGRFCNHCKKTVIDFSALPDDKIAQVLHAHRADGICGHFRETQLNRSIEYIPERKQFSFKAFHKKIAAILLLAPTIPQHLFAWEQKEQNEIIQTPTPDVKIRLQGKIADVATGDPLIGMEVRIAGIGIKYSDREGNFSFTIPDEYRGRSITIEADYQPSSSKEKPKSTILEETILIGLSGNNYAVTLLRYPLEMIGYKEENGEAANLIVSTSSIMFSGEVKYKDPEPTTEAAQKQQQTKGFWMKVKSIFKKKNHKI